MILSFKLFDPNFSLGFREENEAKPGKQGLRWQRPMMNENGGHCLIICRYIIFYKIVPTLCNIRQLIHIHFHTWPRAAGLVRFRVRLVALVLIETCLYNRLDKRIYYYYYYYQWNNLKVKVRTELDKNVIIFYLIIIYDFM